MKKNFMRIFALVVCAAMSTPAVFAVKIAIQEHIGQDASKDTSLEKIQHLFGEGFSKQRAGEQESDFKKRIEAANKKLKTEHNIIVSQNDLDHFKGKKSAAPKDLFEYLVKKGTISIDKINHTATATPLANKKTSETNSIAGSDNGSTQAVVKIPSEETSAPANNHHWKNVALAHGIGAGVALTGVAAELGFGYMFHKKAHGTLSFGQFVKRHFVELTKIVGQVTQGNFKALAQLKTYPATVATILAAAFDATGYWIGYEGIARGICKVGKTSAPAIEAVAKTA